MKKLVVIAAVAALGMMTSCKKEYTCECTYSGGGVSGTVSQTFSKMKKKEAKDKCDSYDDTSNGTTAECSIK